MRYTILLITIVLAGCAARPSFEELEQEALSSGDWSAVESREGMLERRRVANTSSCSGRETQVCIEQGADDDCFCLSPREN
jgi:hypothetical protein